MKKEIIIAIVIVLIVVALNIITQNYTDNAMLEISNDLTKVREDLVLGNESESEEKINKIIEKWNEKREKLVIYIEHAELEKAEMYILEAKSYIETKEFTMAIQALDTCSFVIDHIKEKYEFSWKNIF